MSRKGFSLIELVIALGVVALTVFVFGIAVSSLPLTKSTRNRNIAYHAAAQKLEELRNTPFASLPASGSFSYPIFSELTNASGQLTVSSYSGYDPNQIKAAAVTVTWYENGVAYNVRLDTLLSDSGLND